MKQTILESHLNKLFEAVRWSPSSFNLQPWRFVYARKGTGAFQKIVDCLSDNNKKWAPGAPLLMLAACNRQNADGTENFHAMLDLGLGLGNMAVQAQYMGIGLHHMAGIDRQMAQRLFKIPESYLVSSAIALGYYGGDVEELPEKYREKELKDRSRMPQTEFAFRERWIEQTVH